MNQKPIRICFIARTAYSLFNPKISNEAGATHGGAEVDLYLLALELVKDPNYKVDFITGDFGQPDKETIAGVDIYKCFKFVATPESHNNIKDKKSFTSLFSSSSSSSSSSNKIFILIKHFKFLKSIFSHMMFYTKISRVKNLTHLLNLIRKSDADIYVQEAASSLTGITCFLAKVFKKKFVYRTAHDMDCNKKFIVNSIKEGSIEGFLYEWGIIHSDWLITQNESNQKELLENHSLESDIIKNAYPIYDLDIQKSNTVLWVARGVDWKQPFLFLDLAREVPDTHFIMICPKANEDGIDWDNLYQTASVLNNVTLLNYVPFAEIDSYFQEAKIFVNTSLFEGYPNTFVQATKNATPIVSLNVDPDNFLKEYRCGFMTDGDFNMLIKRVKELLENQTLYSEMSQNALKYAKKEHNILNITKLYKNGFEKILLK